MTPLGALQELLTRSLVTVEEGEPCKPVLGQALSRAEIDEIQARVGAPLPDDIRELMSFARSVDVEFDELNWRSTLEGQDLPDVLPCSVPVLLDSCGNSWNVDVDPATGAWGPVYFMCHDAPVVTLQASSLAEFIIQFADECCQPDRDGMLSYVAIDMNDRIWGGGGAVMPGAEARVNADSIVRQSVAGAANIDEVAVCDLRRGKPGNGFSLSHFGSRTQIKRCGRDPIWLLCKPERSKSWWKRWVS